MSVTSKGLGYHSGPIDQRAVTIFPPQAVLERIQLVLLELNLSFLQSPDSPYKLIVVKNPSSSPGGTERALNSMDSTRPSIDLNHRPSRASGVSRVSMQSSRSGVAGYSSKKQSAGPIGSMVMSIFQKIRYVSLFGFQYNRGYDGSTLLPPVRNQNRVDDTFVKFHIVVHKIRFINGVYIVDLKRHKGDIWEFKRLYNDIIVRLDLKGDSALFV
jgi:protein-serine/threonine kinase